MAKAKLGSKEFDVDCEQIEANECGVSDEECVALGARMKGVEFQRVKTVYLVSFFVLLLLGAEPVQHQNNIGDAGASSLGEGLKCNSSVQRLNLVSCGVDVLHRALLIGAGHVFVWCGAVGVLFCFFLALNLYRGTTK